MNTLNKFDAKIITNITFIQSVHTIVFALENNNPIVQQIAEVSILFPKKSGRKVSKNRV